MGATLLQVGKARAGNYGPLLGALGRPWVVIDFHFWLSVVLTLLAWVPGTLHALWVVLVVGPADEADLETGEGLLARPLLWAARLGWQLPHSVCSSPRYCRTASATSLALHITSAT